MPLDGSPALPNNDNVNVNGVPVPAALPTRALARVSNTRAGVNGTNVGIGVIVTLNVAVPMLPAASVAVQMTAVVPIEKLKPDGGAHDELATPTLSEAVAV